jgi:hypothetical protein
VDNDHRDQISQALHDGLYALLGDEDVTEMEAVESLRTAIYLVNDEWGIETGHRPDPELDDPGELAEREEETRYPKEFHDMKTGSWLIITETELVLLGGQGIDLRACPHRYPLKDIETVRLVCVPGGLATVCPRITGRLVDPPPRFGALSYALDFADALRTAAGIPIKEAQA